MLGLVVWQQQVRRWQEEAPTCERLEGLVCPAPQAALVLLILLTAADELRLVSGSEGHVRRESSAAFITSQPEHCAALRRSERRHPSERQDLLGAHVTSDV